MKALKFTPGQWTITSCDKNNSIAIVMGNVNGRRTPLIEIKALPCIGGHDDVAAQRACDQEHANAHLVLALPELYELAQFVADHPNAARGMGDIPHADWIRMQELARAALAKAVTP